MGGVFVGVLCGGNCCCCGAPRPSCQARAARDAARLQNRTEQNRARHSNHADSADCDDVTRTLCVSFVVRRLGDLFCFRCISLLVVFCFLWVMLSDLCLCEWLLCCMCGGCCEQFFVLSCAAHRGSIQRTSRPRRCSRPSRPHAPSAPPPPGSGPPRAMRPRLGGWGGVRGRGVGVGWGWGWGGVGV